MNFIIIQLYETYKRNGAVNPETNVRLYLLTLICLIIISFLFPIFEIINFYFFHINHKPNPILLICLAIILVYLVNRFFIKSLSTRKITMLQKKHSFKLWPSSLVYISSTLLLIFFTFLGPVLATLLSGGEFFGETMKGILR